MYCVTNKKISFLEETPYYLGAVGKENFSDRYISSNILGLRPTNLLNPFLVSVSFKVQATTSIPAPTSLRLFYL